MQVEKSVFISYRRTSVYIARAVYQDLRTNGFDVFLDYQSIDSGSFERILLNQIAARAHFILILTPSTLERCVEPGDWVRREIEHAMELKRNIVPLMFYDFQFEAARPYLVGALRGLPAYNGIRVPDDYFEEAMVRLRQRFLQPLEVVLHPMPVDEGEQPAADPAPTETQLGSEALYERGKAFYDDRQYAEAIEVLSEALEMNPRLGQGHALRGWAYREQNQPKAAIADFTKAIELEPREADHYYGRALVYHASDLPEMAIDDYTQALRLHPPFVGAHIGRGDAHYKTGDLDSAAEDYRKALRIAPGHPTADNKLLVIRRKKGGPLERVLHTVRAASKNAAEEYRDHAVMRPEFDVAGKVEDYTRALELEPDHESTLFWRAFYLYDLGRFDEAIADYLRVVEMSPRHAVALSNLAECYLAQGDYKNALKGFKKARKLKLNSPSVHAGYALTLYEMGEQEAGLKIWRQMVEQIPGYRSPDWVGRQLLWHPNLVKKLRKLLAELGS